MGERGIVVGNMLQCDAACCSELQCVADYLGQYVAV